MASLSENGSVLFVLSVGFAVLVNWAQTIQSTIIDSRNNAKKGKFAESITVLDVKQTISKVRRYLVPPVSNKLIFAEGIKTMLVGGPNQRDDFHVEMGEELFYQVEGDMKLNIINPQSNRPESITIREGEMFLLPAGVPHSPQRFSKTIGVVFERVRSPAEIDCLRWYMNSSDSNSVPRILYQECFYCADLGTQLKEVISRFNGMKDSLQKAGKEFQWPSDQNSRAMNEFESAAASSVALSKPFHLGSALEKLKCGTTEYSLQSEFSVRLLANDTVTQIVMPSSIHELVIWQFTGTAIIRLSSGQVKSLKSGDMASIQSERDVTVVSSGVSMVISNNQSL